VCVWNEQASKLSGAARLPSHALGANLQADVTVEVRIQNDGDVLRYPASGPAKQMWERRLCFPADPDTVSSSLSLCLYGDPVQKPPRYDFAHFHAPQRSLKATLLQRGSEP